MNKFIKIFFAVLLCILIIVTALIIVFSVKDNKADAPDDSAVTDDMEEVPSDEDSKDEENITDKPEDDESEEGTDAPEIIEIPEDGVVSSEQENVGSYSVSVNPDEYVYVKQDNVDRFYPSSEDGEKVFIEVKFIENKTADELAPSFPDSYIDFMEYEDCGYTKIPNTDIIANLITAKNDDALLEAYLIDMKEKGGVIAVVMSYTAETKEAQTAKFYEILNTLKVN